MGSRLIVTRPRSVLSLAFGVAILAQPLPGVAQELQTKRGKIGWLGIGLECDNCSVRERDGERVWRFSAPPVVTRVLEGSPAERAGLQEGDTLTTIEGRSLTSPEGGARFGMLRPGTPVKLGVRRGGKEVSIEIVPAERPAYGITDLGPLHLELDTLHLRAQRLAKTLHDSVVRLQLDVLRPRMEALRVQMDSLRTHFLLEQKKFAKEQARLAKEQQLLAKVLADSLRARFDSLRPKLDSVARFIVPRVAPEVAGFDYVYTWGGTAFAGLSAVAGAQMMKLAGDLQDYFAGAEAGVLVLRVMEGTPAERVGLRAGDVIVSAGGSAVEDVPDVRRAFRVVGEPVELEVVRKGKKIRLVSAGDQ